MKKLLTLLLMSFVTVAAMSQGSSERIVVREGDRLDDKLYQYPDFNIGLVMLNDQGSAQARLNYNCLTNLIQMLNEDDQVLDISDPSKVVQVTLNGKIYFYSAGNGFVELDGRYGSTMLYRQNRVKVIDRQSQGGYGTTSAVSANRASGFVGDNPSLMGTGKEFFVLSGEQLILEKTVWFYISNNNRIVVANPKNISNLYPKHKKEIAQYIKDNDVNLDSHDSLVELLEYLEKEYSSAK